MKNAAGSGRKPPAILVLDSLEAVLAIAREFLESGGYTVLTASSTRKAIKIAMQYSGAIRLLIADAHAAGASADRFLGRMKKLQPGISVIVMSAVFRRFEARKRAENPSVQFIWKPFSKRELLRKVNRVLASGNQ